MWTAIKGSNVQGVVAGMTTVVRLQVSDLDLGDDDTVDKLATIENASFGRVNGIPVMTVYVEADQSVVETTIDVARKFAHLTGEHACRVYPDLVSASSIAERIGVSREAVRKWVNGTHKPFPPPLGVVGEDMRVWRWIDVLGWLRASRGYDSGEDLATSAHMAHIDACLSKVPDSTTVAWAEVPTEDTKLSLHVEHGASEVSTFTFEGAKVSGIPLVTMRQHDAA